MRDERMGELVGLLLRSDVVDVGEVRITKSSLGRQQGPRFLIYLPTGRNYLWNILHASGRKVRVFIEVPPEATAKAARLEDAPHRPQ